MAEIENLENSARKILNRLYDLLEGGIDRLGVVGDILASFGLGAKKAAGTEEPESLVEPPPDGGRGAPAQAREPRPEGPLVARIAGEEAAFEAPIPLVEDHLEPPREIGPAPPPRIPDAYHDDSFRALPRDPFTIWLYWDFAKETVEEAMRGLDAPRAKLRIFQEDRRIRDLDFALESGSFYVNDLLPGATYLAEIAFVGSNGERRVGRRSNPVSLPPFGPSTWVEDRFATLPWGVGVSRGIDLTKDSMEMDPEAGLEELWGMRSARGGASEGWADKIGKRPNAGSDRRYTKNPRGQGRS